MSVLVIAVFTGLELMGTQKWVAYNNLTCLVVDYLLRKWPAKAQCWKGWSIYNMYAAINNNTQLSRTFDRTCGFVHGKWVESHLV